LNSAATSFDHAADGLGNLRADAPLSEAAAAVPALQTGAACGTAQTDIAAETAAVAGGARRFSEDLRTAARWYETRDRAAAEAIEKTGTHAR
jgi:hypothetical protein